MTMEIRNLVIEMTGWILVLYIYFNINFFLGFLAGAGNLHQGGNDGMEQMTEQEQLEHAIRMSEQEQIDQAKRLSLQNLFN